MFKFTSVASGKTGTRATCPNSGGLSLHPHTVRYAQARLSQRLLDMATVAPHPKHPFFLPKSEVAPKPTGNGQVEKAHLFQ